MLSIAKLVRPQTIHHSGDGRVGPRTKPTGTHGNGSPVSMLGRSMVPDPERLRRGLGDLGQQVDTGQRQRNATEGHHC